MAVLTIDCDTINFVAIRKFCVITIRLWFATTIDRAQWEGIHSLGAYLPQPLFSHGQFCVALSRAALPHTTKVMFIDF